VAQDSNKDYNKNNQMDRKTSYRQRKYLQTIHSTKEYSIICKDFQNSIAKKFLTIIWEKYWCAILLKRIYTYDKTEKVSTLFHKASAN
jgi:hypothetical protein